LYILLIEINELKLKFSDIKKKEEQIIGIPSFKGFNLEKQN